MHPLRAQARSGAQPGGIPGGHPTPIQLLLSSQHWTMPMAGTLLQPSQQILGQNSSSDQEPQQGLGRYTPVLTTVLTTDQQLSPGCTPTPLSCTPTISPITATSIAAPISTLNSIVPCPP